MILYREQDEAASGFFEKWLLACYKEINEIMGMDYIGHALSGRSTSPMNFLRISSTSSEATVATGASSGSASNEAGDSGSRSSSIRGFTSALEGLVGDSNETAARAAAA